MLNPNNNFLFMNPMNLYNPPPDQLNQMNQINNFQQPMNQIPNFMGFNPMTMNNNITNPIMEMNNPNNNLESKKENNDIKLGNEWNYILKKN